MKFSTKMLLAGLATATALGTGALAKDFSLDTLPQADKPTFDLAREAGKDTFYDFMHNTLGQKMLDISGDAKSSSTNEDELNAGNGVSVKLSEHNYNVHINFPKRATGGRSYGWTDGQIGDWSDAMYLNNLWKLVSTGSKRDLGAFYSTLIEILGACDSGDIDSLSNQAQRVATNFLAIYTAEEYRSMVPQPHKNWDDALFEVTLLGAFHGGQSHFAKYYLTKWSDQSKKQDSGVYAKYKPGPNADQAADKDAEMNDYWQFSADPTSKQSGINITRVDFTAMGKEITSYEKAQGNKNLDKIESIVGESDNVIGAIANYFSEGNAQVKQASALAKAVSAFMLDVYADADDISKDAAKASKKSDDGGFTH